MREIKFRAWNPYDKTMYCPTKDADALTGPSYELGMWDGGWEMYEITAMGKRIVVANITRTGESGGTLLQYTGLKDKNGVDIYESDYMNDGLFRVRVDWDEDTAQFLCGEQPLWHFTEEGRYEVEGNIYENPNLLTPKENE